MGGRRDSWWPALDCWIWSSGSGAGTGAGGAPRPQAASDEDLRSAGGRGRAAVGSPRARTAPAPRPRTAPPPPPTPPVHTQAAPTVTMTSLDSIGSCSLDAYASSSEGTDPLIGALIHPADHSQGNGPRPRNIGNKDDHDELASACTLCSVSALSAQPLPASQLSTGSTTVAACTSKSAVSESPEYVRKTARLFESPDKQQDETDFQHIPAPKKPSYLGLACSLSGYSGLTSYDSKLREGFRTRDKSPAPPPPRPLTTNKMPKSSPPTVNGVRASSAKTGRRQISPPSSHLNGNLVEDNPLQSSSTHVLIKESGSSTLRESSRQFMSTMLGDEADASGCLRTSNVAQPTEENPSEQHNPLDMSGSIHYALKKSPGAVRVVEFTSHTKSYVGTVTSGTSSTSMQSNITKEVLNYTSEITVGVNGSEDPTNLNSHVARLETERGGASGYKSFVQQRIERLYGPGALAQGFFSRTRQTTLSEEDSSLQIPEKSGSGVLGSPALPVLRHLRPEFRAQLSVTTSSSRSPRHTETKVPCVFETPQTTQQTQTSIESISDSQPAAPEVPVLVVDRSVTKSLVTEENTESLLLCKEASSVMKPEVLLDKSVTNLENTKVQADTFQCPSAHENLNSVSGGGGGGEGEKEVGEQEERVAGGEEQVEAMNGHYFLQVLRSEINRLNKLVDCAENELTRNPNLPEEAQGKLRAASGQARLLVKQKLQQFEGLCHKNIGESPEEVFPTTDQDLAGFWDMVKLQIDHVDRLFIEIETLKRGGWKETAIETPVGNTSGNSTGVRRRTGGRRSAPSTTGAGSGGRGRNANEDQKKTEGSRKREEVAQARKRLLEERRRNLRQKATEKEKIEIYTPQENGK